MRGLIRLMTTAGDYSRRVLIYVCLVAVVLLGHLADRLDPPEKG